MERKKVSGLAVLALPIALTGCSMGLDQFAKDVSNFLTPIVETTKLATELPEIVNESYEVFTKPYKRSRD